MVGNFEFKWHDMAVQRHPIEVVEAADVEDHVAVAEIADALVQDHAVDRAVAIEIAGVLTAAVAAVPALTVKAHVENLALAASLKRDKKIVVPNQDKTLK